MRSAGGLRSVIGAVSQSPGPRPRYRDSMVLAAAEVFAGLPPARQDGAALLASIRAMRAADGLLLGAPIDLVSRSDSTLRGHVLAEVAALAAVRREATGRAVDAVLLVPAFIEAGRLTAADVHWARTS